MSSKKYNITQVNTETLAKINFISSEDQALIDAFSINNLFSSQENNIELHIYSSDGTLLSSDYKYQYATQLGSAGSAGKEGANILTIHPEQDSIRYGYDNGDVTLIYNFFNTLIKAENSPATFFIDSISNDRLEIKIKTLDITKQELISQVNIILLRLTSTSNFVDFDLNFNNNVLSKAVNIKVEEQEDTATAVVKLYEPLNPNLSIKSTLIVQERISDSIGFLVEVSYSPETTKVQFLKGPNFEVDLKDDSYTPTEYFNFNELFSFPVTNSYYELRSKFNEKGTNLNIDCSNYNNFIHFSSAEERLKNFRYKLNLINTYENYLDTTGSLAYTATGISGSREYYRGLIEGIVNNFDHYDRFLYYESGSNSWPKSNSTRPYINKSIGESESITWYTENILSASLFDYSNEDRLINTIPTFIREDDNNAPYLTFVDMIGQHFDNIWIYTKAVSDKYDGDNRLDRGISKDLVKQALQSFGVSVKESDTGLDNLFAEFTGIAYQSGSEVISDYVIATSGSINSYLQPVPKDDYTKEVYKRIYHNVPLLLKSKGTERAIKALINCFGIPSDLLSVRYFGGVNTESYISSNTSPYISPNLSTTSSLDRIFLDNTGSVVTGTSATTTGNSLSRFTSIVKRERKYSNSNHTIEVGFSIDEPINKYILTNISSSFNIDDHIGDPRVAYSSSYDSLDNTAGGLLSGSITNLSVTNLVRLVKFFDNRVFRTVKEFIPARSNINTGVIIKPHALDRSKIKQVQGSYSQSEYTGSIEIISISGSFGGAYPKGITPTGSLEYSTSHSIFNQTGLGLISKEISDESPKYNGELSGSYISISNSNLNNQNTFKYSGGSTSQFTINYQVFTTPSPTPSVSVTPSLSTTPSVSPPATPSVSVTPSVSATSYADWQGSLAHASAELACNEGPLEIAQDYKHNGSGTYPTLLDYVYDSSNNPLSASWYWSVDQDYALEVESGGRVVSIYDCVAGAPL